MAWEIRRNVFHSGQAGMVAGNQIGEESSDRPVFFDGQGGARTGMGGGPAGIVI